MSPQNYIPTKKIVENFTVFQRIDDEAIAGRDPLQFYSTTKRAASETMAQLTQHLVMVMVALVN